MESPSRWRAPDHTLSGDILLLQFIFAVDFALCLFVSAWRKAHSLSHTHTHTLSHTHSHTHSFTHSFTLPHSLTHSSFPTCSWVLFVLCLQVQQDNWWIDQPLTTVANTTALTFTTQFPLFPSASYSFRVCACNDIGCGVRIPFALVLLPLASIPFRAICGCTFSVMAAKFPCSSSPLPHASMLLLLSFFWFVLFCFWLMS